MRPRPDGRPRPTRRSGAELLRHQRVHRTIEQTAFVDRDFADVAEIVERHSPQMLKLATNAAGNRTRTLMRNSEQPIGDFDPTESLTVVIEESPTPSTRHVWVEFGWEADRDKRLLANVHARLDFHPLIRTGRVRTTEVRLRAEYDPPPGSRYSPEVILFGRRVVRAALAEFLQEIAGFLEDYEETLEMRLLPEARPGYG